MSDTFRVAAVQAAPVFLDRAKTLDLVRRQVREAAANGARLVVFPEAFVPTYPLWIWWVPPADSATLRELYAKLLEESVSVPGPAADELAAIARESNVHLAVGVNERNVEASGTTLFNTILYFDDSGGLLGRHRKLVPTTAERLVHAQGDGSTLAVYETSVGRLGGLICWENYMPLARYAMFAWGVELYLAPTWDRGEAWLATLRHIAREGRVYVVGCCCAVNRDDVPDRYEFKRRYAPAEAQWFNPGDSAIVDPDGKLIAGPVRESASILYADVDLARVRGPRFQFDAAGHYARPDVFRLTIDQRPRPMIAPGEEPAS